MCMTKTKYTVHGVLAAAYKTEASRLTHASADGGETALCKRVKNLADDVTLLGEPEIVTCPICQKRAAV